MDYKYIEQLLERYWQCRTSLEEEAILRAFFSQEQVPAHLEPYRGLFAGAKLLHDARLDDAFSARVLSLVEDAEPVKARKITWSRRLMPFGRAAATVAVILTLVNAAQTSFHRQETESDYDYEAYQESYNDPEMAYDEMSGALQMVSQGLSDTLTGDTVRLDGAADMQNR